MCTLLCFGLSNAAHVLHWGLSVHFQMAHQQPVSTWLGCSEGSREGTSYTADMPVWVSTDFLCMYHNQRGSVGIGYSTAWFVNIVSARLSLSPREELHLYSNKNGHTTQPSPLSPFHRLTGNGQTRQ